MSAGDTVLDALRELDESLAVSGAASSLQRALNMRAEVRHLVCTQLVELHAAQLDEEATFVAAARCGTVPGPSKTVDEASAAFAAQLSTGRAFRDRLTGDPKTAAVLGDIEVLERERDASSKSMARAEAAGLSIDASDKHELRNTDFKLRALLQRNGATMPVSAAHTAPVRSMAPNPTAASAPRAK